jgi:hypothetical protein
MCRVVSLRRYATGHAALISWWLSTGHPHAHLRLPARVSLTISFIVYTHRPARTRRKTSVVASSRARGRRLLLRKLRRSQRPMNSLWSSALLNAGSPSAVLERSGRSRRSPSQRGETGSLGGDACVCVLILAAAGVLANHNIHRTRITPPSVSNTARDSASAIDTSGHSRRHGSRQRSSSACARPAPHAFDGHYGCPPQIIIQQPMATSNSPLFQFGVGCSTESITSSSTGPRAGSSFNPSCS